MRTLNRVPSPQALDPLGSTQSKTGAKFKVPEMGFQRWQLTVMLTGDGNGSLWRRGWEVSWCFFLPDRQLCKSTPHSQWRRTVGPSWCLILYSLEI